MIVRLRATAIAGILAALLLSGCAASLQPAELTVQLGEPIHYKSPNGDVFEAQYGSLSDDSLHFVKVTMPSGQQYTLPQIISASGARYSDERELVWWAHQDTVRVEMRNADGNWETKHSELHEVTE